MKYEYNPANLQKKYENEKYLNKKYGDKIADGMMKFLGALSAAQNAYDIMTLKSFHMEHLKGNLNEYYSISLDKKKSKWRLLLQMLDDDGTVLIPSSDEKSFLKKIKLIRIKELSEHYGEY